MALTTEQAEAYEQLEAAIVHIDDLYKEEGDFINGWVLIVSSSDFAEDEPDEDEQSMESRTRGYTRRSQFPPLTRGIILEYLDSW